MIKYLWLTMISTLNLFFAAHAQKYEREARISASEMPAPALEHLAEAYPERKRTRHYAEHSRLGQEQKLRLFYESKFKTEGLHYSVKFDSLGRLYDVERLDPGEWYLNHQVALLSEPFATDAWTGREHRFYTGTVMLRANGQRLEAGVEARFSREPAEGRYGQRWILRTNWSW